VCKQLAQGCYPVEWWRDPGFELRSPGSHSKCANHYTTEPHYTDIHFIVPRWLVDLGGRLDA